MARERSRERGKDRRERRAEILRLKQEVINLLLDIKLIMSNLKATEPAIKALAIRNMAISLNNASEMNAIFSLRDFLAFNDAIVPVIDNPDTAGPALQEIIDTLEHVKGQLDVPLQQPKLKFEDENHLASLFDNTADSLDELPSMIGAERISIAITVSLFRLARLLKYYRENSTIFNYRTPTTNAQD